MEKIDNAICSVVLDKDYRSFNEAVKLVNSNDINKGLIKADRKIIRQSTYNK